MQCFNFVINYVITVLTTCSLGGCNVNYVSFGCGVDRVAGAEQFRPSKQYQSVMHLAWDKTLITVNAKFDIVQTNVHFKTKILKYFASSLLVEKENLQSLCLFHTVWSFSAPNLKV